MEEAARAERNFFVSISSFKKDGNNVATGSAAIELPLRRTLVRSVMLLSNA